VPTPNFHVKKEVEGDYQVAAPAGSKDQANTLKRRGRLAWSFMSFRGPQALIVILGKVSAKEEISTVVVAARACGNVKNLSLLPGYTGGRQASCGHE